MGNRTNPETKYLFGALLNQPDILQSDLDNAKNDNLKKINTQQSMVLRDRVYFSV
jgi:hypothetical protein